MVGGVLICNLMRISRWYELRDHMVCQEHDRMSEGNANETSGELDSAFGGTVMGVFQVRIP